MHIIFETPRLILRQFTENDAALILQLNSDPDILKYLHEPIITGEEQARKIITDIILPQYKNKLGTWATYTKSDNEFIGWCGLKYRPEMMKLISVTGLKKRAGVRDMLPSSKYTLNYAFNNLNLQLITGRAHIENIASIKVLEKIGMQFPVKSL